jgi:hypothetical protein
MPNCRGATISRVKSHQGLRIPPDRSKPAATAASNRRKNAGFHVMLAGLRQGPMLNSGARDILPELFCPPSAHLMARRPGCRRQKLRAKGAWR